MADRIQRRVLRQAGVASGAVIMLATAPLLEAVATEPPAKLGFPIVSENIFVIDVAEEINKKPPPSIMSEVAVVIGSGSRISRWRSLVLIPEANTVRGTIILGSSAHASLGNPPAERRTPTRISLRVAGVLP